MSEVFADHIIIDANTQSFKCLHCGAEEKPPFMPAPMNVVIDAMDVFLQNHKDCKMETKTYTPEELEYIKGFDHGCDYIVEEIRKFAVQYKYKEDSMPFLDLLVHLKVQEK
jgi:hypothetical protein